MSGFPKHKNRVSCLEVASYQDQSRLAELALGRAWLTHEVSHSAWSNGNRAAQPAGQRRPDAGGSRQSRGTEAGSPVSSAAPTPPPLRADLARPGRAKSLSGSQIRSRVK